MLKALATRLPLLGLCALVASGCTVGKTEAPELSGPSEFALSFGVTATPDSISHDGGSQSAVAVKAFDATGHPKPAVAFRLDLRVSGQSVDYGTLSSRTVVTGADGLATAVYTAPPPLPDGTNLPDCAINPLSPPVPGGCVQVVATPIGNGFSNAVSQTVDIRLIPLGVILPPAATPTAQFTFNPGTPSANSPVQFDASASCSGQADAAGGCTASGSIVSYSWDFGDGQKGSGRLVSHAFGSAQTYSVTLTVTNDRGVKASTTKPVSIGSGSLPTAGFVFSPTPVLVGAEVYFDASDSRPGLGHVISQYRWNWGDGDAPITTTSPLQEHDFVAAGVYTVVLTVVDETGQQGTTSKTVSVSAGNPTASFIAASTGLGHQIQADATASAAVGSASIANYGWSWGDGLSDAAGLVIQTHTYAGAGTYTVTLTVTDTNGKTGVSSRNVTVP